MGNGYTNKITQEAMFFLPILEALESDFSSVPLPVLALKHFSFLVLPEFFLMPALFEYL